jgi:hypothetical protein
MAGDVPYLFNKPENCPSQPFFLGFNSLHSLSSCFISQQTHFGFPHQNYQHIIIPTALRQHSVSRISFSSTSSRNGNRIASRSYYV